ncbi:TPA: Rho termination factor N-terminal domain-containing protein [Bacillus cereus]|nr:Rho termination factor N-terminal domain-containing protein [Bacillus cereus]
MIVETRKTIAGTEYWDNEKKKSLFVPTGEEPGFEVIVNPESMIVDTGFAWGGYLNADKLVVGETGADLILHNKTIKELREYAAELGVEIPADVKKKEDIVALLS